MAMTINSKAFSEWAFDQSVSVQQIICLANPLCDHIPEPLRDYFDETTSDELKEVFENALTPEQLKLFDRLGDDVDSNDVAELICELSLYGFLVHIQTPVKKPLKSGSGWSYSWGYSTGRWFYVNDLSELRTVVELWLGELQKRWSEKAKKAPETPVASLDGYSPNRQAEGLDKLAADLGL